MLARISHARIAVLLHESYRRRDLRRTAIFHLAKIWRESGLDVAFAFGVREVPEADLAIVHVDLSVVPEPYAKLAHRYPIVLNGRILDIRKSVQSPNLVRPGDGYERPVIVKTDLNSAGHPERRAASRAAGMLGRLAARAGWPTGPHWRRRHDYRIFESPLEVPDSLWRDSAFVVEKFLPEETPIGFAAHSCFVLGSQYVCERSESPNPIVRDANAGRIENVPPHPSIVDHCASLRLDYGKIDYTVSEGRCVVLDVNKTVGASRSGQNEQLQANRRIWAAGLYDYLEGRRQPA
jgi:hypothetical protein